MFDAFSFCTIIVNSSYLAILDELEPVKNVPPETWDYFASVAALTIFIANLEESKVPEAAEQGL